MEVNGLPDKIYISPKIENRTWLIGAFDIDAVEYVRKDAFIENALKWYCLDCECNNNCNDTKCFFYREYERYLKGESTATPPKFSGRIINEDGSITENYRYRHLVNRIKEDLINKACEYFRTKKKCVFECIGDNAYRSLLNEDEIRDFKNYMKEGITL